MENLIKDTNERAELKREIIESAERLALFADVMTGEKLQTEINQDMVVEYLSSRIAWSTPADILKNVCMLGNNPRHELDAALIALRRAIKVQRQEEGSRGWVYHIIKTT